ncbi:cardiolipin synthase [Allorhodopirellula heiligendammensis]|uniref:Cardiolipin synthase n=1 Tax=Allorhodopirellula heiligendammensis TaxID=2714739 RepID=A0A5C6CA25_9BACT|nr:cardiolipin synthase [Allorhodopirellula heiligendammensis]TWU19619.1 Cardiolipin synthase [Allorhodopirellula heiligendammensis]
MLDWLLRPANLLAIAHAVTVLAVLVRIIMARPATGVALAWILIVALLPAAGITLYLLIGERRIGKRRASRIASLTKSFREIGDVAIAQRLTDVRWDRLPVAAQGLDNLGRSSIGSPTVCGSRFELFSDTQEMLAAIAHDVKSARQSVLMEFYIWNEGGAADEVLEAVIEAAQRGVHCQILIDALGARPWWRGPQPARLRAAGVELCQALPVGIFRTLVGRTDLRLHRKIVVIDGNVAWTGSMNLVDPRFFKQDSGVGQWVDAMVRLHGAAVAPLAATMLGDWMVETGKSIHHLIADSGVRLIEPDGHVDMQIVPSGPGETADGLLQMLLGLINAAQHELIMTTPYFVPDDSLLRAVRGAAGRGVRVSLIMPEKVDSLLTRYASRSYYDELIDVGVQLYLYRGGLLHTKSIMVDGTMAMFGTVNLDMRSLWLNYEVALFVYNAEFAVELRDLQQSYINDSDLLQSEQWGARSFLPRFLENTLRLVSPLL